MLRNRKDARTNNKEKIDILTVTLSVRRKKKKTVDGDRQTPSVKGRRRPARSRDDASQKPNTSLPYAETRGDVGFGACPPDTDGMSATGWGRLRQRSNVARKR